MPTYEYACGACGHEFEEFQSIKARPVTLCPKCGKRKVKRLISAGAGFIFKGSGFYITDYRSDKYKADAKSDAAPVKADAAPAKSEAAAGSGGPAKADSAKTPDARAKTEARVEAKSAEKAGPKASSCGARHSRK
jgi:putative FmdB family regulatory protein